VAAGKRIPGIARQTLFASFGWMPPQGWRAGTELRAVSKVQANDQNTASAPGYVVTALFAGYMKHWGGWEFNAFARVDNLFNKRYIGSVIVNEGNGRYFEPAPGRNWMVGASGVYRF
jgi:iron complex outermembrane receptor protein